MKSSSHTRFYITIAVIQLFLMLLIVVGIGAILFLFIYGHIEPNQSNYEVTIYQYDPSGEEESTTLLKKQLLPNDQIVTYKAIKIIDYDKDSIRFIDGEGIEQFKTGIAIEVKQLEDPSLGEIIKEKFKFPSD
jgi:hypothetical protein